MYRFYLIQYKIQFLIFYRMKRMRHFQAHPTIEVLVAIDSLLYLEAFWPYLQLLISVGFKIFTLVSDTTMLFLQGAVSQI